MATTDPTRSRHDGPIDNVPGPAGADPTIILVGEDGIVLGAPSVGRGSGPTNGGAGGSTTSPSGTTASGSSTSPFVINITWDSSVANAPVGFTSGVLAAVAFLESQYTDPVTINISVGYGEVGGSSLGSSALGSSLTYLAGYSYSTLYNALKADATTAADASGVAALAATSPVANANYWVSTAEAKALGLMGASTATDGYVGFSASLPFDYNSSDGITAGTYDFYGTVVHELTEVMARLLLAGTTIGSYANSYDALDLFRFSSSGTHTYSTAMGGYFSTDNGQTNRGTFNTTSGGDYGDWKSLTNDSFNAFSSSGVINPVTTNDLTTLDAIGWNLATSTNPSTTPTAPTGVAFSQAVYVAAAIAAGGNGLAANAAIARASQVGGTSGDTFSYQLGGADSGLFTLTSASNLGSLSVGANGVAGAVNGRLYNLTVTATDTTASPALSSPAAPLGVIVGSSSADAISVSSVLGNATTPAFIYGLAGNDTLNGAGISAPLFFAGGAGADAMTAGSGADVFMYGATTDSNASAMDIISSFAASQDLIDLRGLGVALNVAGPVGFFGKLAAHSIAWQVSGGNTYIYINTSNSGERLSSADMKIELAGNVSLTSANFQHL